MDSSARQALLENKRKSARQVKDKSRSSLGICLRCFKQDGKDAIPGHCVTKEGKTAKRHRYAF